MRRMVVGNVKMLRRDIIHSYKSEKPQQSVSLLSLGKSVRIWYAWQISIQQQRLEQWNSSTHTPALLDLTNESAARWLA